MIGCTFIPQGLAGHKKRTLVKALKRTAGTGGYDLPHAIADEPIKNLRGSGSANRRFAERDLLALVFGDIDGIVFGHAKKYRRLNGFRLSCIFRDVIPKERKHALLRQLQIQSFMGGINHC